MHSRQIMRHTDHPRPWPDIRRSLTSAEIANFLAFAQARGFVIVEHTPPEEVEPVYQDWLSSGSPDVPSAGV